jgi:hypothetical protein
MIEPLRWLRAAAGQEPDSICFTAAVELRAAEAPKSPEDNTPPARPSFSINAYNGGPLSVDGFYHPVVVDMAGAKAAPDIAVLMNHDDTKLVGQGRAKLSPEGIGIEGTVTGDHQAVGTAAHEFTSHAKNGFKWQASIGGPVVRREFLEPGQKATVNGRVHEGPKIIAREFHLKEVSVLPLGADRDGTSVKVAARDGSGRQEGNPAMNPFEQWLKANGFDPATLPQAHRDKLEARFKQEHPSDQDVFTAWLKAKNVDPAALSADQKIDHFLAWRSEAAKQTPAPLQAGTASSLPQAPGAGHSPAGIQEIRAEAKRIADVERLAKGDDYAEIRAKAISEGWSANDTELAVLRAGRQKHTIGAPFVHVPSNDVTNDMLVAAACTSGRLRIKPHEFNGGKEQNVESFFDDKTLQAAHTRWKGQLGLQRLILEAAWRNGYRGIDFKSDHQQVLQAAFSTNDLSGILSNLQNKFLLMGFMAVEQTWRAIAQIRPANDFKPHYSYRLTGDFEFEQVGADGELHHGTADELTYSNQVETYGRMFSITRQQQINDDLGAFNEIPRRIGRGGALKFNDVFWTLFMSLINANGFFVAGNNNYFSGAGSALSVAALTQAVTGFLNQTDPDGKPLGLEPTNLLVPNALYTLGGQLETEGEIRDNTTNKQYLTGNPHRGRYKAVRSSYLSNATISGNSTTGWGLFANPADMAVIEAMFLNGQEMPTIQSAEADFNTLGIQVRGFFDFGVGPVEFRGGNFSAGV